MAKVAINGFGRIGRLFFRQAFDTKGVDIVAINDLGDLENLAYLLRYDTVYGRYDKDVEVKNGKLVVGGKKIEVTQEKDPSRLPWGKLGVHVVVESTGVFEKYEEAKAHIEAGAKRVVMTAPAKDEDGADRATVLIGVNDDKLKSVSLSSNASCTTNSASPVLAVLSENPGIKKAVLNTTHAYTASQSLVDGPVRGGDFRKGRAAAENIVPHTTGSAIAVSRAIESLVGKFDGVAMRVPVPAGSIAAITFVSERKTSAEEVNDILRKASLTPRWKGILKVSDDALVSRDIVGEPYGAIVDAGFTKVVDGDLVNILSWYDNEWGYVSTLVKHVSAVAKFI